MRGISRRRPRPHVYAAVFLASVVALPAIVVLLNYEVFGVRGPNYGRLFFVTVLLPAGIAPAVLLVAALLGSVASARTHFAAYFAYLLLLLCLGQAFFFHDDRAAARGMRAAPPPQR